MLTLLSMALMQGAEMDATSNNGDTQLSSAACNKGHTGIAMALIDKGRSLECETTVAALALIHNALKSSHWGYGPHGRD
jgi:hypothetical protein